MDGACIFLYSKQIAQLSVFDQLSDFSFSNKFAKLIFLIDFITALRDSLAFVVNNFGGFPSPVSIQSGQRALLFNKSTLCFTNQL